MTSAHSVQSLDDVAGELGVQISIKHKKINISNPRVSILVRFIFIINMENIVYMNWHVNTNIRLSSFILVRQ